MGKTHAAITAVGGYVPEYILGNAELEKMVDTTDEWITTRTGIKERRILKGDDKATSDMCVEAVKELCKKRGIVDEYFERFNYEIYGGSPILGINSTAVVGHGISNERAIKNMILLTKDVAAANLSNIIKEAFN